METADCNGAHTVDKISMNLSHNSEDTTTYELALEGPYLALMAFFCHFLAFFKTLSLISLPHKVSEDKTSKN